MLGRCILESSETSGIEAPAAGPVVINTWSALTSGSDPTGSPTIDAGSNRKFVLVVMGETDLGSLSVTVTVGGVAPSETITSNLEIGSGAADLALLVYIWNEAAIGSMSGTAISWDDSVTWGKISWAYVTVEDTEQAATANKKATSPSATSLTLTWDETTTSNDQIVAIGLTDTANRGPIGFDTGITSRLQYEVSDYACGIGDGAGGSAIASSMDITTDEAAAADMSVVGLQFVGTSGGGGTPTPSGDFFSRWPQVRTMYTISNTQNILQTYATWTYVSDLVVFQGIHPGTTEINTNAGYIAPNAATYPNCRLIQYTIPPYCYEIGTSTTGHRAFNRNVIEDASASASWLARDPASGTVLWGRAGTDQDNAQMTNLSRTCPDVGGKNYVEAYADDFFTVYSGGDDIVQYLSGVYFDSADYENAFPPPVIGELGSDFSGVPDYNVNSTSDDAHVDYRNGFIDLVSRFRTNDSTFVTGSNGGRDYAYSDGTLSSFSWYQAFGDFRVVENANTRFGIVGDGAGGYDVQSNIASRGVPEIMQHSLVCYNLCLQGANNNMGRAYAILDYAINGGVGVGIGDYTETDWVLMEFLWAMCMSTEEVAYGVRGNTRQQCAPPPDLYIVDTGDPSTTRSLGTLAADGESFTLRTADDTSGGGTWYFTEFDNGYIWLNLTVPTASAKYLSDGANTTSNLPTPPAGKKGQTIDPTTYTNTTDSLSAQGYSSSRNDGSDVTSISARPYTGGWVSWVDV